MTKPRNNKYSRNRKKKRGPEEGYQWAPGGRSFIKDPNHPRWSVGEPNIDRIAAHTDPGSGEKHGRDNSDDDANASKKLRSVSIELEDRVRRWSNGIYVDMTCKEFGEHLLEIAREIAGSKDFLVESVKEMCDSLGIHVGLPKVIVEAPKTVPQVMGSKALKILDTGTKVAWDPNAYYTSKDDHSQLLSYTAQTSAKSRDVGRLQRAVNVCGTVAHATVALHHFITVVEPQIGVNLGVIRNPDENLAVAADILREIKAFLESPRVQKKNTNDAISLQKTLFSVITPPAPSENASEEELRNHKDIMKQIVSQLNLMGASKTRVVQASKEKRDLASNPELMMETKLVKHHRRKVPSDLVMTPELIDSFEKYLLTCEATCDSPNRRDVVYAKDRDGNRLKDEDNGGFLKARNRYYQRGLGWLYQHATKPVAEGGFEGFHDADGNICVSQTTMERMMPHNYKRMTTSLKASCRCSNCLDAEYLHQDLMSWRNQRLKVLEREVSEGETWLVSNHGHATNQAHKKEEKKVRDLRRELAGFKADVFRTDADGNLVQKVLTMEQALGQMTCQLVGPNSCQPIDAAGDSKFHMYKCCLGRCDKCPALPINRGEQYFGDTEGGKMIIWRKHEHRSWCKLHGAIETGNCSECLLLPECNQPKEKPRKTYDQVKKTAPIGEFMRDHYAGFNIDMFRQHNFLRRALGKNWCKELRNPYTMLLREGHQEDVHSGWDYADRMQCEYHNATMTETMGGSAKDVGMEGCCYHMMEEIMKKIHRHWYGFLSDERQQDARISFINRRKFIEDMQANGKLKKGATLWIQTDGCSKQYKCHNFMQMHILLAKLYKIRIDVMITAAGHGKCLVDSLGGTDKHHLDNGRISEMDPTRVDEYQQAKSEAYKACIFLGAVDRMLGSYKHTRQTEDQFEIKSRKYAVSNYDRTKTEVEAVSVPFKNTNFGPVSGWKTGTKNGIKEMFHFRFDYRVDSNTAMARRIPCACLHCTAKLDSEWVGLERDPEVIGVQRTPKRVHPRDQPSYQQPEQCVFREMMMDGEEDLNAWHFIDLAPMEDKCDDEELDQFFTTAMENRVKETESEIEVGGIGALSAITSQKENGFYLIEWTKKPHTLQSSAKVFGMKDKISAGHVVCEGVFWNRIDQSNDWYEPQENNPGRRPKRIVVLLTQVLCGKVCFKRYIAGIIQPPATAVISAHNRYNLSKLIRLGLDEIDFLQVEQMQREGFELVALEKIEKKKKQKGSDDESDKEEEEEYIDNTWER